MEECISPSESLELKRNIMESQVMEIIGGIKPGKIPLPSCEEAVESVPISLDEGDDSVFYDNEVSSKMRDAAYPSVNIPRWEPAQVNGAEVSLSPTERGDTVLADQSDKGHIRDTSTLHPEQLPDSQADVATNGFSQQHTALFPGKTEKQTESGLPRSTAKGLGHQWDRGDDSVNKMISFGDELHGKGKDEVEEETAGVAQDYTSQGSMSVNHPNLAKYNTVSYRRIRKGNTRQRIDEFESMMNT